MKEPQNILGTVEKVMKKVASASSILVVRRHWDEIAGTETAKHSVPAYVRKGKMTVVVDSSPWLYHVAVNRSKILERVQQLNMPDRVEEIRLKQGDPDAIGRVRYTRGGKAGSPEQGEVSG